MISPAAISSPEKFVLDPQREGGGNNVYGADNKPFLENIKESDNGQDPATGHLQLHGQTGAESCKACGCYQRAWNIWLRTYMYKY